MEHRWTSELWCTDVPKNKTSEQDIGKDKNVSKLEKTCREKFLKDLDDINM